ncbi:MAG: hypothetical protein KBT36_16990 [Kurthia sp.]|nr:hypothetical protein [Candidatus Kurthia equi]
MAILRKPWVITGVIIVLILAIFFLIPVEKREYGLSEEGLTTDDTRLLSQKIQAIEKAENRQQLVDIIKEANENDKRYPSLVFNIHRGVYIL